MRRRGERVRTREEMHRRLIMCVVETCERVSQHVVVVWSGGRADQRTEVQVFGVCRSHYTEDVCVGIAEQMVAQVGGEAIGAMDRYEWRDSLGVLDALVDAGLGAASVA